MIETVRRRRYAPGVAESTGLQIDDERGMVLERYDALDMASRGMFRYTARRNFSVFSRLL